MVCAIGYCTLQWWLLLVLKSKEFGGVGDRRGNTCQVPNVWGYHHLGSSTQKFRIQRFRAMFNNAQATCEDSLKQGHIITKTDVMFTIDDAIRQSNQPLFFILTRICRLLRNQRWATRTENLSIQTVVILPSFFFWFFFWITMHRTGPCAWCVGDTTPTSSIDCTWVVIDTFLPVLFPREGGRGPGEKGETLLATYIDRLTPFPAPLAQTGGLSFSLLFFYLCLLLLVGFSIPVYWIPDFPLFSGTSFHPTNLFTLYDRHTYSVPLIAHISPHFCTEPYPV